MGQIQSNVNVAGIESGDGELSLRGVKPGYVSVKVSSLLPNRGPIESYSINPSGAILYGSNGNPDGLLSAISAQANTTSNLPDKIMLQDTRIQDLLILFSRSWYIYPAPEIFSRHSGTCLIIGDRTYQHPPVPIKLGDCFRLGSVGVVVSELKTADGPEMKLDAKSLQYLRDEAVAFDIAEEEACLAANEGGFDGVMCQDSSVGFKRSQSRKKKGINGNSEIIIGNSDDYEDAAGGTDNEDADDRGDSELEGRSPPNVSKFFCYMCYEAHDTSEDPLVAPCLCRGDTRYLHVQCLQKWYQSTGNGVHAQVIRTTGNGAPACKICGAAYKTVFRNAEGRKVSLLEMNNNCPYITLIVVTKHDTNASLFNTRFRLNFNSPNNAPTGQPVMLTIGRSSGCNMVVDYRTVSTRHARIYYERGEFFLQDQRSSNGTMLYLREPMPLLPGRVTKLRVGRSTISFEVNGSRSPFNAMFRGEQDHVVNQSMFSCLGCAATTDVVDLQNMRTLRAFPHEPAPNPRERGAERTLASNTNTDLFINPPDTATVNDGGSPIPGSPIIHRDGFFGGIGRRLGLSGTGSTISPTVDAPPSELSVSRSLPLLNFIPQDIYKNLLNVPRRMPSNGLNSPGNPSRALANDYIFDPSSPLPNEGAPPSPNVSVANRSRTSPRVRRMSGGADNARLPIAELVNLSEEMQIQHLLMITSQDAELGSLSTNEGLEVVPPVVSTNITNEVNAGIIISDQRNVASAAAPYRGVNADYDDITSSVPFISSLRPNSSHRGTSPSAIALGLPERQLSVRTDGQSPLRAESDPSVSLTNERESKLLLKNESI